MFGNRLRSSGSLNSATTSSSWPFQTLSAFRKKVGLGDSPKAVTPAVPSPQTGDTALSRRISQATIGDADEQSVVICTEKRPSKGERALRHAVEIGAIAGPAMEMVPGVGGTVKALIALGVDILKQINLRWENQAEIEHLLDRVQTFQSIVAGDGFLGELSRSFGSAMQFKRRLDEIVNDLASIRSRGGIDYGHIAGDIKAVQKKLDDTIAECNLAMTFIVAANLENTRFGNVARIVVVDPFGNLVPFSNVPDRLEDLAEYILRRLSTNPAMSQDLKPYVRKGQFEFHLDYTRSDQDPIHVADLASLQHGERIAMLVVEVVAPATATDCVTCPHCDVNIPITKRMAKKKIVYCSECGRCIKSVDNVSAPLPPRAVKKLSRYLTGVIVKTIFPQLALPHPNPQGPELGRAGVPARSQTMLHVVPKSSDEAKSASWNRYWQTAPLPTFPRQGQGAHE